MNMNEIKELNLEEEELVAAGTVNEYSELQMAMFNNPALKGIVGTGSHVPLVNAFAVDAVKDVLKGKGVDADISLGVCGSGLFSSPNKYVNTETNQEMSHQEVLNILKGA